MTFLETLLVSAVTGAAAAVITLAGTMWVQSQRQGYADRTRFIDLRRERYSEMLRESDEHVRILKRQFDAIIAWLSHETEHFGPPPLATTDPLSHIAAEIALLGRKDKVGEAANELYTALVALDRYAWDSGWDPGQWINWVDQPMTATLAAYDVARIAFVAAAKEDLGTAARRRWPLTRLRRLKQNRRPDR